MNAKRPIPIATASAIRPAAATAERAHAGRSTISTQFGLVPIGCSPSLASVPLASVDRVAAEPMRGLADGDEKAAVGRDREAARLALGRNLLDRRQRAARGVDRERGDRARAALARVEKAAVGREMQIGGPRRADVQAARQGAGNRDAAQRAGRAIELEHVDRGVELVEQEHQRRGRMEDEMARPGAGARMPRGRHVVVEAAASSASKRIAASRRRRGRRRTRTGWPDRSAPNARSPRSARPAAPRRRRRSRRSARPRPGSIRTRPRAGSGRCGRSRSSTCSPATARCRPPRAGRRRIDGQAEDTIRLAADRRIEHAPIGPHRQRHHGAAGRESADLAQRRRRRSSARIAMSWLSALAT